MGQELIKSAVDASVFLINLTSALIKFVMTAALVPVCHQTQNKLERPAKKELGGVVNVGQLISTNLTVVNGQHSP